MRRDQNPIKDAIQSIAVGISNRHVSTVDGDLPSLVTIGLFVIAPPRSLQDGTVALRALVSLMVCLLVCTSHCSLQSTYCTWHSLCDEIVGCLIWRSTKRPTSTPTEKCGGKTKPTTPNSCLKSCIFDVDVSSLRTLNSLKRSSPTHVRSLEPFVLDSCVSKSFVLLFSSFVFSSH